MVTNRSAAPGSVIPTLVYENVGEAISWLCETFGFTERFRYGLDEQPSGAQLAVGSGCVFLIAPRVSEWSDQTKFSSLRRGEISHAVDIRIENIDAHYQHCVECEAHILHPPETYPFGERQYTVEDLEGRHWTFTESVADVAPEEWGGKSAKLN
jgi:uncharacterized glyoxalase superfamily protein PhnB